MAMLAAGAAAVGSGTPPHLRRSSSGSLPPLGRRPSTAEVQAVAAAPGAGLRPPRPPEQGGDPPRRPSSRDGHRPSSRDGNRPSAREGSSSRPVGSPDGVPPKAARSPSREQPRAPCSSARQAPPPPAGTPRASPPKAPPPRARSREAAAGSSGNSRAMSAGRVPSPDADDAKRRAGSRSQSCQRSLRPPPDMRGGSSSRQRTPSRDDRASSSLPPLDATMRSSVSSSAVGAEDAAAMAEAVAKAADVPSLLPSPPRQGRRPRQAASPATRNRTKSLPPIEVEQAWQELPSESQFLYPEACEDLSATLGEWPASAPATP
mmetsp:Transcript_63862/g.152310  ORF Transcript_63862/g.152310 Transcript_63862/m.152310 type:complete len:319 (-) Transcript_63862:34-990(-)